MNDAIDLKHLPDTYELPKAPWKITALLVVSLTLFIGGFAMASGRDSAAVLVAVFFGLCTVIFMFAAFARSTVSLDRDGLTYHYIFGSRRYAWRDVSEFTYRNVGRARMIVFNDAARENSTLSRLNRFATAGYNAGISAAFIGGSLDDACAQLNAFRARSLKRGT